MQAATDWLLDKQVTRRGDWSERTQVEPGGWFFEFHNEFYPDVDDTIMALMACAPNSVKVRRCNHCVQIRWPALVAG